jgi:glycosyltransferase involved in cell wall biosynthesis
MLQQYNSTPKTGVYIPKYRNTYRLRQFINNSLSGLLIGRLKPDIIHSTYYLSRFEKPGSCPKVVTVFDMIHEKFGDRMDRFELTLPAIKKHVVEQADHVICISEQTRRDVIDILGIKEDKTTVIYLASSFVPLSNQGASEIAKPYYLYVGSREWPKNFRQLVKAFAGVSTLNKDVVLVCFGGGEFSPEEVDFFRRQHLSEKQVLYVPGNDEVLGKLYSGAIALVYPSLYEGFGLPLLEAMSCGCPVLCSSTGSMPEVAGDAALYFEPARLDEMIEAMQQVAESSQIRNDLINKGRERLLLFSWDKCARETAQVYRSCLENS